MPRGVPLSQEQKAKMAEGRARYKSLSMEEREAIKLRNLTKKQNRKPRKTFEERQALGLVKYRVPKKPSDKPRRTFEERQALGLVKYRVPNKRRTFEERQALGLVKYRVPKQRRTFEERQALGLVKYKPARLPPKPKMVKALGDIVKEQNRIARALATARKQLTKEIKQNT